MSSCQNWHHTHTFTFLSLDTESSRDESRCRKTFVSLFFVSGSFPDGTWLVCVLCSRGAASAHTGFRLLCNYLSLQGHCSSACVASPPHHTGLQWTSPPPYTQKKRKKEEPILEDLVNCFQMQLFVAWVHNCYLFLFQSVPPLQRSALLIGFLTLSSLDLKVVFRLKWRRREVSLFSLLLTV